MSQSQDKEQPTCEQTVTIVDAEGLHMRACRDIVDVAGRGASQVQITCGEQAADATSILELLLLAAECGAELRISAQGPDADQVVQALVNVLVPPDQSARGGSPV
jgi:phosphocarrier protein NPr